MLPSKENNTRIIRPRKGLLFSDQVKNYYSILDVHYSASMAEIKRAYRRLAVLYHPDKNPDPRAQALFQEINEAYDVLGDAEKRKAYDISLAGIFTEILQEAQEPPPHRDPAYRRKRPHPGPRHHAPTPRELMAQYLPYFRWLQVVGLAFPLLLALDLALPHQTYHEKITDVYQFKSRKGSEAARRHVFITTSGREFRTYGSEASYFYDGVPISITVTPLFSTEMRVSIDKEGYVLELGYIYRGALKFISIFLFAIALFGMLLREHTEFAFSVSIACGVIFVILLYLVLKL